MVHQREKKYFFLIACLKSVIAYLCAPKLKKRISNMLIIPVKEGESIEKSLKKFKRKVEKTGLVKELRERQKFTKPSVRRREEIKKAIYSNHIRSAQQD
jgi:small subunit ribosomal protein S21